MKLLPQVGAHLEIVPQSSTDRPPKKYRKTQHRGVQLIEPDPGKTRWRVRYRDPDTQRIVTRTLPAADSKSAETRTTAALQIHRTIRRRHEDIEAGAAPHLQASKSLPDAIAHYYKKHEGLHAKTTVADYRAATDALLGWCKANGVHTVRQLSAGKLREYSLALARLPKRERKKGGRRGEMHDGGKRSEWTVNKYRRNTGIVLNALRKLQVIRLSRDEISDSLERTKAPMKRRAFLKPDQIQRLLERCQAHDAETFTLCRDGSRSTPRYEPITPFVIFVLLTGLRVSEALQIKGEDVEGLELHVSEKVSKTKTARTVDLSVTSTLQGWKLHNRKGFLWKLSPGELAAAKKRLIAMPGCPRWSWHALRRTCGTYLTNAPGIFGGASAWRSAKQLGHSVVVSERHYVGCIKISPEAKTLEAAYQLV